MTTNTNDFWCRAARHAQEQNARDHYNRLARIASKYSYAFYILLFQSPDDSSYYTVAAGNLSPRARKEVKQFFSGSSITLSSRDLALLRKRVAEQHQRFDQAGSTQDKAARTFEENGVRGRLRPDQPGVARTHSSAPADQNDHYWSSGGTTFVTRTHSSAPDDQPFYEKKEHLLRRVQAGTATPDEEDWLKYWGFLGQPKPQQKSEPQPPNPTYPGSPTQTSPAYRYRGPMKATPVAKLEGPGRPGTHKNRYGKLVASKKGRRSRRRSVFVRRSFDTNPNSWPAGSRRSAPHSER